MKRLFLLALAALFGFALLEFLSAPQFWKRYVLGFMSGGQGAYSRVFDFTEEVRGAGAPLSLPTASDRTITQAALDDMQAYAIEYDSFSLLVLHQGEIQLEWYKEGYDRDSLTQSQSMHKSVQALLTGIALDQGLIESIDEPVSRYVPELSNKLDESTTIRDVLSMSSGLRPFKNGFSPWGEAFRWLYAEDINAATLAVPQIEKPGVFNYNDVNTQLLGILLSRVYGARYASYLSEYLWQPIGAEMAYVWLDSDGGVAHHNCCLLATTRDWAKLGLLFASDGKLNGRQIVSQEWIEQQTSRATIPHYGYQTWLASNESEYPLKGTGLRQEQDWLDEEAFFFSGYGGQRVYVSRKHDLVVVRLGPAAGYFPKFANAWDNAFLLNTAIRGVL